MENSQDKILSEVAAYYTSKVMQYGATPQGVDWNGEESQVLRFRQLSKIINTTEHFSINDIGCGYGAFFDYLARRYNTFSYAGYDVSNDMVIAAREYHKDKKNLLFHVANVPEKQADYSVASGIFNVRLHNSDNDWLTYLDATLAMLDSKSRCGFAFNCLTLYSDADKMKEYLFYADPCYFFDFCKRRFSRNVALLHDYDLYEFTILVRKDI